MIHNSDSPEVRDSSRSGAISRHNYQQVLRVPGVSTHLECYLLMALGSVMEHFEFSDSLAARDRRRRQMRNGTGICTPGKNPTRTHGGYTHGVMSSERRRGYRSEGITCMMACGVPSLLYPFTEGGDGSARGRCHQCWDVSDIVVVVVACGGV